MTTTTLRTDRRIGEPPLTTVMPIITTLPMVPESCWRSPWR
ncbi:MAG TPA: hypothetical protein PKE27_05890 [Povalibacter sp.]|nr:hypothetical protein [Povalibacter sp.]HMN44080.1 hypothetical protein [Povalibacter sp.]